MYNRYIPQSDGSFRRSRVPDPAPPPKPAPVRQEQPVPLPREDSPVFQPRPTSQPRPIPPRPKRQTETTSVGSFLKQLLPKDFDTEDLLIVLMLLLMSGDCKEDQNTALLTLALYLFM